ncbi:MAG: 2-polyprenylphenol 6-hydroxylase [Alphaproteobacteria bacterium]|nr:2-polyprenylphenol 6-hydroxylase [Alphaproteobacteria bacterium]MDE1986378.1 2-polyprenylphenol 6-hydroxylase [Alphaproteobacteria bacterium]MDE2164025.1 2-polyprenylphenol 6-hydroxylase [Alphaproteobacteria bacterium]MDE2499866.1 2-polyprenylphenol 6-hydroxylase [Alphaproteobacteria bacterium]
MADTLSNLSRLWTIARTLGRNDALIPREYLAAMPVSLKLARRIFGGGRAAKSDNTAPGLRLARALENLGPAHIKLGQILATRPDIVGSDIASALEGLQDRLPSFPTNEARKVVVAAFGRPVEELFSSFGEPVAAASIAQVHEAMTAEDPPHRVAVKVLRPGVEAEFARDLSALAFAARIAETLFAEARRLRLTALVEILATSVALELDLRMEAAAASELAERTRNETDFRVPSIDWKRTAERVLTTEWIDGISVRDIDMLRAAGRDPKQIALTLMRTFLTQALREGFFHADLHPGNLFVDGEGCLVAVDFGIMGRLDPPMRRFMAETLAGFLARDYVRVAQVHYDANFVSHRHPVETFAQALRAIGEPIFGRPAQDVSMAKLLQQLFDTTRRFDMSAQPQLLLLQKTMVVVEGVARGLDPEFDIWEASRPVVERWMLDRLGPEARLREAAEGMGALGRVAQHLPQLLRNVEVVSTMLADGGLRLHPDTARQIAEAQLKGSRYARVALWLAAGALGVIAMVWIV